MMLNYTLLLFLAVLPQTICYNYLIVSPVFGFSHMKFMGKIADELVGAGHNVTFFQPFISEHIKKKVIRNSSVEIIDYYHDEEGRKEMADEKRLADAWDSSVYTSPILGMLSVETLLGSQFEHMCRKIFQDTELQDMLRARKYDAIISETFDFCGLFLGDYLEIPSIVSVFSANRMLSIGSAMGESSLFNYVPDPNSNYGSEASIIDRFNTIWFQTMLSKAFGRLFNRQYDQVNKLTNGKVRHWEEIMNDVTYHLTNSNPYIDFVTPSISKVIPIGGFTINLTEIDNTKLSIEYEAILSERESTVFISFGSMMMSSDMPRSFRDGILEMFELMPNTTFLWKYEKPNDDELKKRLPKNVYLKEWFPQAELLADERVNVFVTHGGLASIYELAYSAKPAVMIPLFADQPVNANMMVRHESCIKYSKFDLQNGQKLAATVKRIIETPRYSENAKRLSHILRHQPIDPTQQMLRHIENAARFGRMPSLSPHVTQMGFIAKCNIDIILITIILSFSFVYFCYKIMGFSLGFRSTNDLRKEKTF